MNYLASLTRDPGLNRQCQRFHAQEDTLPGPYFIIAVDPFDGTPTQHYHLGSGHLGPQDRAAPYHTAKAAYTAITLLPHCQLPLGVFTHRATGLTLVDPAGLPTTFDHLIAQARRAGRTTRTTARRRRSSVS